MDLSFTKEDLEFQQEVRDWIAEAYTPELRAKKAMSKNGYLDKEGQVEWQKRLYEKGWVAPSYKEEDGAAEMKKQDITIKVDLGLGDGASTVWTCDLTHQYITINADYRS